MNEGLQEKDETRMCAGKGSESRGHCGSCAVIGGGMSEGSRETGKGVHGILVERNPLGEYWISERER